MKKVIVVILLIALVMVFMAPVATAKGHKVDVCHVNGANDSVVFNFMGFPTLLTFGKVISVSEEASPAHEAHGDRVAPTPFNFSDDPAVFEFFEEVFGISLPNANCWWGEQI